MQQWWMAYYSEQADRQCGSAIYKRPNGQLVAVSEVTKVGEPPLSVWPDLKKVGVVLELVKEAPEGSKNG